MIFIDLKVYATKFKMKRNEAIKAFRGDKKE